jgi:transcriptional regulator with XRE-family HTH domain
MRMTFDTIRFAADIEAYATRYGLTRAAIADESGCSRSTVTRLLKHHKIPDLETYYSLVEMMGGKHRPGRWISDEGGE